MFGDVAAGLTQGHPHGLMGPGIGDNVGELCAVCFMMAKQHQPDLQAEWLATMGRNIYAPSAPPAEEVDETPRKGEKNPEDQGTGQSSSAPRSVTGFVDLPVTRKRISRRLRVTTAEELQKAPSLRQLQKLLRRPNTAESHYSTRCFAREVSRELQASRDGDYTLMERTWLRLLGNGTTNPHKSSTSPGLVKASSAPQLELSNRFAPLSDSYSMDCLSVLPPLSGKLFMRSHTPEPEQSDSTEPVVESAQAADTIPVRRRRPDCMNRSAFAGENVDDEPGEDRPIFYPELQLHEPTIIEYDTVDHVVGERTIIAKLQCDAAFQKRDEHLLRQLKMKAQRYVAQYDTCNIRPEDLTNLIIHSVAAAYQPSRAEMIARRFLTNRKVEWRVKAMNEFLESIRPGLLSTLWNVGKADLLGGRMATNFA